jgi:hypothetical protein
VNEHKVANSADAAGAINQLSSTAVSQLLFDSPADMEGVQHHPIVNVSIDYTIDRLASSLCNR